MQNNGNITESLQLLTQRIKQLEKKVASKDDLRVSDKLARAMVDEAIRKYKQKGAKEIGVLEVYFETHLPFKQINRVMAKLEKEGVISEPN